MPQSIFSTHRGENREKTEGVLGTRIEWVLLKEGFFRICISLFSYSLLSLVSQCLCLSQTNKYRISLCILRTHDLCTLYTGLSYPWWVIIILMCNAHRCFSLKNLGKNCALYTTKHGKIFKKKKASSFHKRVQAITETILKKKITKLQVFLTE